MGKAKKDSTPENPAEAYMPKSVFPLVFRESRRVLPNVELNLVAETDNNAPKSAPPRLPGPSPWLAPLQGTYVDVYVNGACS